MSSQDSDSGVGSSGGGGVPEKSVTFLHMQATMCDVQKQTLSALQELNQSFRTLTQRIEEGEARRYQHHQETKSLLELSIGNMDGIPIQNWVHR